MLKLVVPKIKRSAPRLFNMEDCFKYSETQTQLLVKAKVKYVLNIVKNKHCCSLKQKVKYVLNIAKNKHCCLLKRR